MKASCALQKWSMQKICYFHLKNLNANFSNVPLVVAPGQIFSYNSALLLFVPVKSFCIALLMLINLFYLACTMLMEMVGSI